MKTYFPLFHIVFFFFSCLGLFAQTPNYRAIPAWYNNYDIKFYAIDLEATDTTQYLSGKVTIQSVVKADLLDTFNFELVQGFIIDSVHVSKTRAKFSRFGNLVKVVLPEAVETGKMLSVTVFYQGTVLSGGFFSSFSNRTDHAWKIPVTWTLSEPFGARQWLPCKQFLPDKIDSAWIFITVPKNRKAGSNGVLTKVTPIDSARHRFEWKTRYPVAYYLISFTVADYQDYSFYAKINDTDSVLVQNYIYNRPDYLKLHKDEIDATGPLLRFYSSVFGDYPFKNEKYGHCVAPISGGMEHQTMTTLSGFDFQLVAHELAHQWFGNWATCSSWQDIWINEGFASYAEYLALDSLKSHQQTLNWMFDAHRSALYEPTGSIFVSEKEAENEVRIFNYQLSYKKGASIIHSLRYELNNDKLFFKILRDFLQEFKNSVAGVHDFQKVVNQLSQKNYSWFFDQWYFGKGYPIFDFSWKQRNDTLSILSHQTPSGGSAPFFKTSLNIRCEFEVGDTTLRFFQDTVTQTFQVRLPREVQRIEVDPENYVLKKIVNVARVLDFPSYDDFFQVLPNPFTSNLTLRFKSEPAKERTIKLTDVRGTVLFEQKMKRKKEISIEPGELLPGVYLVYVLEGNNKYIRKVLKVR